MGKLGLGRLEFKELENFEMEGFWGFSGFYLILKFICSSFGRYFFIFEGNGGL